MEIVVDKRTELMSVVLALSQGNEYIEEHFCFDVKDEYRKEVFDYFSKYKQHKCVKLAKILAEKEVGFNFDNPIRLAFCLNKKLEFNGKVEEYLLNELEDEKLIKEFMIELEHFARDSQFDVFYIKHSDYYLSKIQEVENLINKQKFLEDIENFLKRKITEKFEVNIIPMLINSNHGFTIDGKNIANIGLVSEDFKTILPFDNGYKHILIHEFCHSFVNSNTNTNKLNIPKDILSEIKKDGYNNPIAYLNDTIVRAMAIRFREKLDKIDAKKFLERENSFGFVYVKDVYQELLKYEKQDLSWEKYFPKLMLNLSTANKKLLVQ